MIIIGDIEERTAKGFIRFRYLFVILCMTGMSVIYSLRTSYNIAVVTLFGTNHTSFFGNSTLEEHHHLENNLRKYKNLFLPAYFLGFGLFGVPGARLAELYSAKRVAGTAAVIYVAIYALTVPIYSLDNVPLLLCLRVIEGLSTGMFYPAMVVLTARWSPPSERFVMCAITFCGIYLGGGMGYFAASVISDMENAHTIVFFLGTSLGIIWFIFHIIYIEDYPQFKTLLSTEERNYIVSSLDGQIYDPALKRKSRVPWKRIFESGPFLSLLVNHFATRLVYHVAISRTVESFKTFQWKEDMNRLSRAIVQSSPYFWGAVMAVTMGLLFTTLFHQRALSKKSAFKITTIIGLLMPVILLTVDYFGGKTWELAAKPLLIITLAGVTNTLQTNHIELAPNYAGTLVGITTSIAQVNPLIIHLYPEVFSESQALPFLYGATSIIALVAMIIYYFLHSTEVQPWNQNLKA